jgi:acetyl-CoA synthetase
MSETKKGMESLQSEGRKFPPPANIQSNAWVDSVEQYETMWKQSIDNPDGFWLEQAKSLTWFKEPTQSLEYTWDTKARKIEHTWFKDGELNVSSNCLDRHLGTPIENKDAIVWQGEAEDAVQKFTYKQLHADRWFRNWRLLCWPARESARSTRSSSAVSVQTLFRVVLMTLTARC